MSTYALNYSLPAASLREGMSIDLEPILESLGLPLEDFPEVEFEYATVTGIVPGDEVWLETTLGSFSVFPGLLVPVTRLP